MYSDDAVRTVARHRGDAVVVTAATPLRLWAEVSASRSLDLDVDDAAGKAADVALGVALARRDRRVIVLDGDGPLLSNLGVLVTIGEAAPRNLVHILLQDGVFPAANGVSVPIPGTGHTAFAGMARDAGYAETHTFDTLEDFAVEAPRLLREAEGPVFVALRVRHRNPLPAAPIRPMARMAREVRDALKG